MSRVSASPMPNGPVSFTVAAPDPQRRIAVRHPHPLDAHRRTRIVDRVLVLAAGRPVAFGTPAEVLKAELLTTVYEHEIEVLPHPRTGVPLIVPVR